MVIKNKLKKVYKILKPFISSKEELNSKPKVINLLANDICNSKCTMCNIWKKKLDYEISSTELAKILKDDLYSEVEGVGITGGEPTLRDDLLDLYKTCIDFLPNLKSISIITNAIKKDEILKKILSINELAAEKNIVFSAMVSLDGLGKVHDLHRGREGNFDSAIELVQDLKSANIPVMIGCTITKQNVWGVDELYDYLQDKNITARFRIGEFIDRLYNNDNKDEIRAFTSIEKYHLSCFFTKLKINELNFEVKNTYNSIIQMLNGAEREMGCPYQTKGIVLDSRGDLMYCAPKSKIIGNGLMDSSTEIYNSNLAERARIMDENCADCIHDYHSTLNKVQSKKILNKILWNNLFLNIRTFPITKHILNSTVKKAKKNAKHTIFIVGWYGTETVGDKAILASIIEFYKNKHENLHVIIAAIYPFITKQTLIELDIKADIVETYSAEFISTCKSSDEIIMGGGPLMEIEDMIIPYSAFYFAKKNNKKTVVFGCGIGPLYTDRYTKIVTQLLKLADEIKLRDKTSIEWANENGFDNIEFYGDPAKKYITRIKNEFSSQTKKNVLACFLREWEPTYKGNYSLEEFYNLRNNFEEKLAASIKTICKEKNLTPKFYSMHTFVVGGDDRIFYRSFVKKYFVDHEYYIENHPSSVNQIVKAMSLSKFNICMRFHSVLFADVLNVDFMAIDYTNGGKIKAYLEDNNKSDLLYSIKDIVNQRNNR